MIPRLVSVDPGDPSGWAYWAVEEGGRWLLRAFGELADPDGASILTLLGRVVGDCQGVDFVVEGQWYRDPEPIVRDIRRASGRGRKGTRWTSPKTGRVLEVDIAAKRGGAPWDCVAKIVACRGRWESQASSAGMRLHDPVAPGRWIPATTKGHPERDTHKRIRDVTIKRYGDAFSRLGYDEAAAILLGEYWIIEHGGLVTRAGAPTRGLRDVPEEGA